MPLLKNAKKKLRQDKVRTEKNRSLKNLFRDLVKKAKASGTPEAISAAFQSVDKATKNHLMHPNKAARIKSSLSKVTTESATKKSDTKTLRQSKAKKTAVRVAAQAAKKTVVKKNAAATTTNAKATKKKK
jgi:small subunit ribosomal protein S20